MAMCGNIDGSRRWTRRWTRRTLGALAAASALVPCAALAQEAAPAAAPASAADAPSESAMVNLVRALVEQGALKADVGEQLIRQAEAEAAEARTRNAQAVQAELPAAPPGAIRVPYVPETVRAQIREELKTEVMAQAKAEGWAAPQEAAPEWTRRIQVHGDVRFRSETQLYAQTNADDIIDYATINAFSPYGIDDLRVLLPVLNSRNDRWNNLRLRARLGIDVDVTEGVSAGIAIATGDNEGPISTNAVLAGGFFKRDLWLDKAWLKIQPIEQAWGQFGRFGNVFDSSDLLYDPDLNFDGAALSLDTGKMIGDQVKLTLRGGAFPFDYGAPNYPTFAFDKPEVGQKYLFAGELEAALDTGGVQAKLSAGYHVFHHFQGDLSEPCETENVTFCSTDDLQPLFLTKGNTLSPLRQIVTLTPDAELPQILGYTFAYNILDINASVAIPFDGETAVRLSGSFVQNLAFDEDDICRNGLAGRPYNNAAPGGGTYCAADPTQRATFAGGDIGYRGEVRLGRLDPEQRGDWTVFAGYRYLESDAVLDALTDSDFHLGGTNQKGYFIGGTYYVRDGLSLGGRWLSTNEISGPPLAIDVLQLDMQVGF